MHQSPKKINAPTALTITFEHFALTVRCVVCYLKTVQALRTFMLQKFE